MEFRTERGELRTEGKHDLGRKLKLVI